MSRCSHNWLCGADGCCQPVHALLQSCVLPARLADDSLLLRCTAWCPVGGTSLPVGCFQWCRPASCRLLYLQGEALEGIDVRSIIYLVRSTMQNAQLIAQQVKATNRWVGVSLKPQARLRDEEQAAVRQLGTVRTLFDVGMRWRTCKLSRNLPHTAHDACLLQGMPTAPGL